MHPKPKGESRFNLKKSTTGNIAGAAKKGYGKKAKLLEFNIEENDNPKLLEEPVELWEDDRLPAARGVIK